MCSVFGGFRGCGVRHSEQLVGDKLEDKLLEVYLTEGWFVMESRSGLFGLVFVLVVISVFSFALMTRQDGFRVLSVLGCVVFFIVLVAAMFGAASGDR